MSLLTILIFIFVGGFAPLAEAVDYTSTNFILRNPVITIEGGRSTSTSFEYFSSTGQTTIGEATSTSFTERAGFLYFPDATAPVLTATAGDEQISLSWTASVGASANVTDYDLGTATVSGGPYTFESVGNVLSFTKTGLTNDTTYYFLLRANANTLILAESSEASATPVAPAGGGIIIGGGGTPDGPGVVQVVIDAFLKVVTKVADFLAEAIFPSRLASDLNRDNKVNEHDISILLYAWQNKPDPQQYNKLVASIMGFDYLSPDINDDKNVDSTDLSIMLSNWSG